MKAYIYCIYNNKYIKNFYIGSTKDFKIRMDKHKSDCNNPNSSGYNYKLYKFIRENGGWSEFSKMIIATVDVIDKIEQRKIEQVYIDHLEPGLNDCRSYRTLEQRKDYEYDYRIKNRELINKKMNCMCGGKYTKQNKTIHERSKKHQKYILKINQTITKINI